MDTMIIALFLLNNFVWMFFFYLFTPRQQTRKINLPNPLAPLVKKEKPQNSVQELTDLDMTPQQVIQQMKG